MVKRLRGMNGRKLIRTVIYVVVSLNFASMSYAKPVSYEMPATIDGSAHYLFFLHNYYVEQNGPNGGIPPEHITIAGIPKVVL